VVFLWQVTVRRFRFFKRQVLTALAVQFQERAWQRLIYVTRDMHAE